jgi:hypothetical protein
MAREEVISRKIIIEESRTIRELPDGGTSTYNWLEHHIIRATGIILLIITALGFIGYAIYHALS